MSASQQKKKRRQSAGEPAPQRPEEKSGRGAWIAGGVFVAVIAVLAIFFGISSSGFFHRHLTAATAGSHKVSPAMYNYFYQEAAQLSYDAGAGELRQSANDSIARAYALYDEAEKNGFTLSEAQQTAVDTEVSNLDIFAQYSNAPNAEAYLTAMYGTGCNVKSYREYAELRTIGELYTQRYQNALEYSADEIQQYYDENRLSLDTVSYRSFTCESQEDAEAFAAAAEGSETAFAEQARQYAGEDEADTYASDSATLRSDQALADLPEPLTGWLIDGARVYGETTAIDNEDGTWAAVQFIDNWTKYEDVTNVNVRHILIRTGDDVTAEQAKAKADEILAQYLAGEQTEEAFAQLAVENSADSNAAEGGLYEDVAPGDMVDTFNDWCFDEARKPGDTGVVETSYGAHVMYYVGQGHSYRDSKALSAMRAEAGEEWADGLGAALPVENNSLGMRLTSAG